MIRYKMNLKRIFPNISVLALGAALLCAASCINIDNNLGQNFIPRNQIYDIRTATLDIKGIELCPSDSLSGYSSSRITIGAIKDETFGLTRRSSAFTVIPVNDTIDMGKNTKVRQFHFTFVRDTLSYKDKSQHNIIQNVNVYQLHERLDSTYIYANALKKSEFDGDVRITNGVPVYNGGDSLSFDMSKEYAQKYIDLFSNDPDIQMNRTDYLKQIPGIYMCVDDPIGDGGRINMFDVGIKVSQSYYVTGNYAELKVTADYGKRENVDTSFLFYFGPQETASSSSSISQYAFNLSEHDSNDKDWSDISEEIIIEGGSGIKPVIKAKALRDIVLAELSSEGVDPSTVIINKASIILPFKFPEDYEKMSVYPSVLSPTIKVSTKGKVENEGDKPLTYVSYGGLTDASVDSEDQGDINRSLGIYSPDISHHMQTIIKLKDDANFDNYDIWMLIMAYETVESSSSDNSMKEYYQNLAYANYYNSMYDPYGYGGYGGYGYGGYGYGYGGYGYGYSNYYNYMIAAQYASASSQPKTSTSLQLDKDRFYACRLGGVEAQDKDKRPRLELIYSFIKKFEEE